MKIVITGAKGFLGNAITRVALEAGHDVVAVDLPSRKNTLDPYKSEAYTECLLDLLDPPASLPLDFHGARAVIHCAARITGPPHEVMRTNVAGTEALLPWIVPIGARLVLLSSMAVLESHPGPYGRSKQEAEARVRDGARDFAIIRPTMIYGRNDPLWTEQIRKRVSQKKLLFLPGMGRARIQPLYVEDAARFILKAALHDKARGRTFSIGGPEPIPQIEFLRQARNLLKGKTRFIPIPLWPLKLMGSVLGGKFAAAAAFNQSDHAVDNTLAEKMIGFDPRNTLEGLSLTFS
ncbi:MAG: NAD(P)-dependent oxidoreductase [Planctomycetota bacterium]